MIKILVFVSLLPFISTLPQRLYESIFYPDNYYESQYFGYYIIMTDSIIFISAIQDDSLGNASGSVYFYRKDGNSWTFIKKILASDGGNMHMFGVPYLSSNFFYVGAIGYRSCVYVFEYLDNDWVEIQKLLPDTPLFYNFGRSIKEFNNELFVGAISDSRFVESSGAVYVFKKNTNGYWEKFQKIYPRIMKQYAHFGHQIEVNTLHNHLIVSAPSDSNEVGRFAGNVYILKKSDSLWQNIQILSPDVGEPSPYFGGSLATKGDYLFVGAPGDGYTQSGGTVYVYKIKNGLWEFVKKINSPINVRRDYFGNSIFIEQDSILIGAPGAPYYGARTSRVYLYYQNEDDFTLEYIFEPSDTILRDGFGMGVAINKGVFLIGAPYGSKNGLSTGKAYLYSPNPVSVYDNENLTDNFELYQNYPNPFNPSTKISWQSPVGGHTTLKVYDILGREIATPINEYRDAGKYEINFPDVEAGQALSLQSGVYFYQLRIGNYTETKKMILIR
ncbi:T9SS type A sorting domain-containing protein [Ignavibacterium album]|nr:T9SS type A sorting domain-containing protein [Ignavibacterium album]